MKSKFLKYLIACCVLFSSCHNDIWDAINALDARVTKLEEIRKYIGCDIRMYLDSNMKNNIEKAGFEYSEFSSDEFQLVFIW